MLASKTQYILVIMTLMAAWIYPWFRNLIYKIENGDKGIQGPLLLNQGNIDYKVFHDPRLNLSKSRISKFKKFPKFF